MAGPQPIFTAFPFPRISRGTTGTKFFKEQLRAKKLPPPWLAVKRAFGLVRRGIWRTGSFNPRPRAGANCIRTGRALHNRTHRDGPDVCATRQLGGLIELRAVRLFLFETVVFEAKRPAVLRDRSEDAVGHACGDLRLDFQHDANG